MHEVPVRTAPCTSGPHHAEVAEVWPRDGQILLWLTLAGTEAEAEQADLVLEVRGRDNELRLPTAGSGGRFEVRIPLDCLAAPGGPRTGVPEGDREWVWDLHLAPRTGRDRLRLGKHLDDVKGKKGIFVYPAQRTEDTWVEPYFTVKDNLSIRCHRGSR
ncbi:MULTISPECIES: hypothetical protein [unclassified Streptomyces]|uniref:hypothetical protein n=1 Tax=unclassified Streptomyces TaxID=2593676 RepID=UPI0033FEE930